jgi:drug/metabolite transporter (DMT)-like permease
MKTLVLLAFAAVYVIWGSTYLAIRVGIESFPPFVLAGIRHVTAGLVLYAVFRRKTGIRPTGAHWWTAAVTGFMLLFIGNGGVSWAEQTVPSGIAALLVATVSLWLVIFDWLRPGGIRPVARVTFGLLLGFGGLVLLVGPAHLGGSERVDLRGAGVLMVASLAWAWGSLYSKHRDKPAAPMLNAAMQSFAGGVVLLMAAALTGEFHGFHFAAVSIRSWLALVYLIGFGHRIQRLCLHFGKEHAGASGNLRVRESRGGIVPRMAHSCRAPNAAYYSCCRGHSHGGDSGDYRAASNASARQGVAAGSRRSVIAQGYRPFDFSTLGDLSG